MTTAPGNYGCPDCGAQFDTLASSIAHRCPTWNGSDDDVDDFVPDEDRDDPLCSKCGKPASAAVIMNGLCPMCFECTGGGQI